MKISNQINIKIQVRANPKNCKKEYISREDAAKKEIIAIMKKYEKSTDKDK